ncbi:MAG: ABC transporter permease [Bacteroidales bacterium]|nr:ABC transporter permease [Bacteroidales bacterium]
MSKIGLIIEREYVTRVRKKSFILVSILLPLGFLLMALLPSIIMAFSSVSTQKIAVLDETKQYESVLANTEEIEYTLISDVTVDGLRSSYQEKGFDAMLHISGNPTDKNNIHVFSEKSLPIDITRSMEYTLRDKVKHDMVQEYAALGNGVDSLINAVNNVRVNITTMKESSDGGEATEDYAGVGIVIGMVAAMLIYFVILFSGAQVFAGVMEEKQNRIMEVLASTVKPMELMLGKIVGIALVTLTQLAIWGVMLAIGSAILGSTFAPDTSGIGTANVPESNIATDIMNSISGMNIGLIATMFVIYTIGGYFLYASLYATIAAGCEQQSDAQQLQTPILLPIIAAIIIVSSFGLKDPNCGAMFWGSMIPLTSPIVMLARIPNGVEAWELILSITILIASFVFTTWFAGKVYRIGILMYGKKPTFKDLIKWARMK